MASDYWNHNVAFHRRIARDAALRGGSALDVGCGDGLLLARLAAVCRRAVGLETDERAVARARRRLEQTPQAEVLLDDVMDLDLPQRIGTFETVTCVATLHHLPLEPALVRLSQLVAPGGRLIVVGLAANKSLWDWTLSALAVLPLHVVGALRRETDTPSCGTVRLRAREGSPYPAHGSAAWLCRGGRAGAWQTIRAGGISRTRA